MMRPEIPLRGWPWRDGWVLLLRVKSGLSRTNASIVAAGLAFYAFLAIPSAFAALIALYGLVFNTSDVQRQVEAMTGVMPGEAVSIISSQLQTITAASHKSLSVALGISIVIALWSARSGMASLMTAMTIAYEEPEQRGFIAFEVEAFLMTAGATVFAVVALALIAVLPAIISLLPLGDLSRMAASSLRWPVLVALLMIGLSALYRFGPSRPRGVWRWADWGAVAAAILWLIGSALFSLYVTEVASYNKTYGSLGAVVVLLMWLYVSGFAVMFGAALNAAIEHEAARSPRRGEDGIRAS